MKDPCTDPSMTINAAMEELRANGMSISQSAFTRMAVNGHFPFAWGCPADKPGKQNVVLISTHLFREWLRDYLGHEPIEVPRI